jgi:predicted MFS family arabinose efflux permease
VLSVFASSQLRRLIGAYTVNRLGTWFGFIALSIAVFDHTHSAIAVAAVLIAAQVVPAVVAPALVARVETSTRGRFSELYFFEAAATAALAVLLWHFWLPVILLLAALDGTAALAANALLRAETARAARNGVEAREAGSARDAESLGKEVEQAERDANAAVNVAFSLTFVLGPALAGGLVAAAGAPAAIFIDAASFLICGAMLVDLRAPDEPSEASVQARLLAAWRHIRGMPMLRALLLAEAAALVFFESAAPIEVAYAKVTLHAGDRGYGVLVAAWGLGAVIGSVVFARSARRPLGAMLTAGILAIGLAYLGFSAAPSLGVACAAAVVGGVGNGVEWASVISIVQRLTPQRLHGQLMGAVESLGAICPAVGLSLGGALVALSSPRQAFLVVGIASTAMAVPFLVLYLRGLDQRATAESAAGGARPPARPVPEVVP